MQIALEQNRFKIRFEKMFFKEKFLSEDMIPPGETGEFYRHTYLFYTGQDRTNFQDILSYTNSDSVEK